MNEYTPLACYNIHNDNLFSYLGRMLGVYVCCTYTRPYFNTIQYNISKRAHLMNCFIVKLRIAEPEIIWQGTMPLIMQIIKQMQI